MGEGDELLAGEAIEPRLVRVRPGRVTDALGQAGARVVAELEAEGPAGMMPFALAFRPDDARRLAGALLIGAGPADHDERGRFVARYPMGGRAAFARPAAGPSREGGPGGPGGCPMPGPAPADVQRPPGGWTPPGGEVDARAADGHPVAADGPRADRPRPEG